MEESRIEKDDAAAKAELPKVKKKKEKWKIWIIVEFLLLLLWSC